MSACGFAVFEHCLFHLLVTFGRVDRGDGGTGIRGAGSGGKGGGARGRGGGEREGREAERERGGGKFLQISQRSETCTKS